MDKKVLLGCDAAYHILNMIRTYTAKYYLDEAKLYFRGSTIVKDSDEYEIIDVDVNIKSDYRGINLEDIRFNLRNKRNLLNTTTCTLKDMCFDKVNLKRNLKNVEEISVYERKRIDFSGQLGQLLGNVVYDEYLGFGFIMKVADNRSGYGVFYEFAGIDEFIYLGVTDDRVKIYNTKVRNNYELLEKIK